MKRILVTGGAGFIGSHLCAALLPENQVFCLDNFFTGSEANITALLDAPNFELIKADVTQPLPPLPVDEIYNLACPASPVHYQRDPVRTTVTSVQGAINVLELARQRGAKVLQASTSEVYGDPLMHPQPEHYNGNVSTIGPRACYDEGKRCAETLFFDYARQHGVRIKVARIFNTYGPNMHPDDGRVVSNFIVQALQGLPITLYGDGMQTRSFCYVDDMVQGLQSLMQTSDSFLGPVNLGNDEEFTMRELAQMVLALTSRNQTPVFKPLPADDPKQRKPDLQLARQVLNWQPRVHLAQGLQQTLSYFRQLLDASGHLSPRLGQPVAQA